MASKNDKWSMFKNYMHNELGITKEDIREKNVNFIAYLLCGILAITAFSISGNKKGLVKEIEPIKKEVKIILYF